MVAVQRVSEGGEKVADTAAGRLHTVVIETFQVWELPPSSPCTQQSSPRVALNGGSIEDQEQIHMHAPSVKPVKLYKGLQF